jgi:membrane protein
VLPNTRSDQYRKRPITPRLLRFGGELVNAYLRIDAMGLAKQVSYSLVFAVIPAIFVIVAVATIVENLLNVPVTRELREFIIEFVPKEGQELLLNAVDAAIANTSTQTASIGGLVALVLALWAGMGGVATLVEATNRAYGVRNTRSWYKKRIMTLVMTIALTLMIVLSVVAAFMGNRSVEWISDVLGDPGWLQRLDDTGQDAMSLAMTFSVLLLLYRYAPAAEHTWRWSLPGAMFSTLSWIGLLEIAGYIARRINYDNVYGAASGFLLLMYLLNFGGIVLIVGAVLNGVLGQRYDPCRREDLELHPEKIRYVESGQEVKPDPFKLPFRMPRR